MFMFFFVENAGPGWLMQDRSWLILLGLRKVMSSRVKIEGMIHFGKLIIIYGCFQK